MFEEPGRAVEQLGRAVTFALAAHKGQQQKMRRAPYGFHLLGVASLILEHGGSAEVAIAGVLHDVLEDTTVTPSIVSLSFGPRVLELVQAITNPPVDWRGVPPAEVERRVAEFRQKYLEHIQASEFDIQLLSAADKLHNARCFVDELRRITEEDGEGFAQEVVDGLVMAFWGKFRAKRDGTIQYYRDCAVVYAQSEHAAIRQMGRSLRVAVDEMLRY